MRRKIDYGLSRSRYGIVILSPNFFKKEWPQRELDGLTAREIEGKKVILPVWHNVGKKEVMSYSPVLADRLGISTSTEMDNVISELLKVISSSQINKNKVDDKSSEQELPIINVESTVFFSDRMAKAFPGLNGLNWFNSPEDAVYRLSILLQRPLEFRKPSHLRNVPSRLSGIRTDPIWWWRGYSNMQIKQFEALESGKCLADYYQFNIAKIGVYRSPRYDREFVYVETNPDQPTGLYNYSPEDLIRMKQEFGYVAEEYGVFDGKLITRTEYDDGSAVIDGKVVDAHGAKLRIRYLTPYNFIIAAAGSPINNKKFDIVSSDYLNGILDGRYKVEEFVEVILKLEPREE